MTHTPGPWHLVERDNLASWSIQNAERRRVAACRFGNQVLTGREEAKANARLIAAAPDMLDALSAIVKWADDLQYFSERGSELAPVFLAAKAAIAKATGEA